jgi:orotidine-5'-phosphate decarboxylase
VTPPMSQFRAALGRSWSAQRHLCVGLDCDYDRLPSAVRRHRTVAEALVAFNTHIVEATADYVCAYKPNIAFYEAQGAEGIEALVETVAFIRTKVPEAGIILDGKRGDIGNSNARYASAAFDLVKVDALTVTPYLGAESLSPFLERRNRTIFVLVKTSNPGAGEFQDLPIGPAGRPLYEVVADHVATSWNKHGNCGVVVGATDIEALRRIREIVGDLPILVPGVGAQGGDLGAVVHAGRYGDGGLLINSSREIIYASDGQDYAQAAGRAAADLSRKIVGHFNENR